MAAITWRTVAGPSLGDPTRALALAQQSFDNAFAKAGDAYKQYNDGQAFQANEVQQGHVQDIRNLVQGAGTAEEAAALQNSPALLAKRALLTPQNQELVRGAEEKRLTDVQNRTVAGINFKNTVTDEQLRPLLQKGQMIALQNPAGLPAFMAANPELAARYGADLTRAGITEKRASETFDSTMASQRSQREVSEGTLALNQLTRHDNRVLQLTEALGKAGTALAEVGKNSINSLEGIKAINDTIKNLTPEGREREALTNYVGKLMNNPRFSNMPASDVMALAMAAKPGRTSWWDFWNSDKGASIEAEALKLVGHGMPGDPKPGEKGHIAGNPEYLGRLTNAEAARGIQMDRAKMLREQLRQAQEGAAGVPRPIPPVLAGTAPAPQAPGAAEAKPPANVGEFVKQVLPQAEKVAAQLGVPVDSVIGQWGLETGWGKSVIPGTNNFGNIKDFSGQGPKAKDNMTGSVDSYRKYANNDEFAEDYIKFLSTDRYGKVRGAKDANSFFSALKEANYAEDKDYVTKGSNATDMVARARREMGGTEEPEQLNLSGSNTGYVPRRAPEAAPAVDERMQRQIALERDEIAAGLRKDFSKEIRDSLQKEDREALKTAGQKVGNGFQTGSVRAAAAAADLFTLPVRGAMGAANTVLRLPNALGADIPYIPDGGMLSSMTPYSDMIDKKQVHADLKKRREEFEREILGKKAR